MRWRDNVYIHRALPFGLQSAPKLFTTIADLVACQGVTPIALLGRLLIYYHTPLPARRPSLPESAPNTEQAWHPSGSKQNGGTWHIPNFSGDLNRLS